MDYVIDHSINFLPLFSSFFQQVLATNLKLSYIAPSRLLSKIYLVCEGGDIKCVNLLQDNLSPKLIGNMYDILLTSLLFSTAF